MDILELFLANLSSCEQLWLITSHCLSICFSSPGRSTGRAVVLPLVSALVWAAVLALANVKVFTLKLFM